MVPARWRKRYWGAPGAVTRAQMTHLMCWLRFAGYSNRHWEQAWGGGVVGLTHSHSESAVWELQHGCSGAAVDLHASTRVWAAGHGRLNDARTTLCLSAALTTCATFQRRKKAPLVGR